MPKDTSNGRGPTVTSIFEVDVHLAPVLYDDEDPIAYIEFRKEVFASLQPVGVMEKILADDNVHHHWEAMRHRRLLLKHIASCEPEALDQLLEGLGLDDDDRAAIVTGFASGAAAAVAEAEKLLSAAGHDLETIRARAVAIHSEEIGRLQALIASAEKRRNRCVRDLANHRDRMRRL